MAKGTCPVCGMEIELAPKDKLPYSRISCPRCLAALEVVEMDLVRFRKLTSEELMSQEDELKGKGK